jgi:ribosome biogenesis GTPase
LKGLVIKSTGSWYHVQLEDGTVLDCRIKGKFRIKGIKTTNPIAVGDQVSVEIDEQSEARTGLIYELAERKNYIIRKSINLSKQTQIIASNIDQALLVVTLSKPRTSFGFIDRFLVTAEAYHIPVVLLFNKIDQYDDEDLAFLEEVIELYEKIGYPCRKISALKLIGIAELKNQIAGQTSLLSGHSGVGKSTLINQIIPSAIIRTSTISAASEKGIHTTTFAEMHPLETGGYIIDTPGIRELGVVDIPNEELAHYFPEMKKVMSRCKFHNCKHLNEPNCAVKEAYEKGIIAIPRYESYLSIMANEDNRR